MTIGRVGTEDKEIVTTGPVNLGTAHYLVTRSTLKDIRGVARRVVMPRIR